MSQSELTPFAGEVLKGAVANLGVHEVGGANEGASVEVYQKFVGIKPGDPWCFTGDVEILTENGWTPFRDLNDGVRVAQVDEMRIAKLVEPLAVIRKHYTGDLVKVSRRSLTLHMDPEHRLFGNWKNAGKAGRVFGAGLELRPVSELADGTKSLVSIPVCCGTMIDNPAFDDRDLKLIAAWIADGFVHRGRISIQVSRPDKIAFLKALDPNHVYRAPRVYGETTQEPLTTFEWLPDKHYAGVLLDGKVPSPAFIWSLSGLQARTLLDTVTMLDRQTERGEHIAITQSVKRRTDALHHLAVLAGYGAQTTEPRRSGAGNQWQFGLSYDKSARPFRILSGHTERIPAAETDLYCVSVPSGLIVVRPQYGRALVVGNCAAFVSYRLAAAAEKLGLKIELPRTGSSSEMYRWFLDRKLATSQPAPGMVCFLRGGPTGHRHTCLVERVDSRHVLTIDGNEGDKVERAVHDRALCDYARLPA